MSSLIEQFKHFSFTDENGSKRITHIVYYREGRTETGEIKPKSPAVLLMHEITGMTKRYLQLAKRVSDEGFTVYLPLFFGKEQVSSASTSTFWNGFIVNPIRICIAREIYLLSSHKSSPITDWLRALCQHIYSKKKHREFHGIGAIGMCLTGGFVLSLMLDQSDFQQEKNNLNNLQSSPVKAPVICQPALPIFSLTQSRKEALGVPCWELEKVKERVKAICDETNKEKGILAIRFEEDRISPDERFQSLKRVFGNLILAMKISSQERKKANIPGSLLFPPHAVLTESFANKGKNPFKMQEGNPYDALPVPIPTNENAIQQLPATQKALAKVLNFLKERL